MPPEACRNRVASESPGFARGANARAEAWLGDLLLVGWGRYGR
jgi:hypothetical protein